MTGLEMFERLPADRVLGLEQHGAQWQITYRHNGEIKTATGRTVAAVSRRVAAVLGIDLTGEMR